MNLKKLNQFLLMLTLASLVACGGDDGSDGVDGINGVDGVDGIDGTNGMDGVDGIDGIDGDDGVDGNDGVDGIDGLDGVDGVDAYRTFINLEFIGRYESGVFDESAAEIVSYDPATSQVFVVNANTGSIDVIDISSPSAPVLSSSLDVATDIAANVSAVSSADALGAANSVAVHSGVITVAVEADVKQDNGYVAFYQTDGTFLSAVEVGALPDMVTFVPSGDYVLVANEGEPNDDYSSDPEGSVSVIDLRGGVSAVEQSDVTTIRFDEFNVGGSRASELDDSVRISAKSASVAQDLEPEYIAVSSDSTRAWVAMQENNALAEIDLVNMTVVQIKGLGYKDHGIIGNELDASNRDEAINIRSWPLRGLFMPDSIDVYRVAGTDFVVTANEGDAREYLTEVADETACTNSGGFEFDDGDCLHYLDEIRIGDIADTGAVITLPNLAVYADSVETLTADENLGRIKVAADMGVINCTDNSIATTGQPSAGCEYEALYSYGARSFSIWNGSTGELVFDSGNDFEAITAQRLGRDFNATNDENGGDNRSDDKGPEPEAIEIATINGAIYAFIGLERVGGVMVYDISNPEAARFIQYISTRNFNVDIEALVDAGDFSDAGDLGPESILFIAAEDSPSGAPLLVVGNEVSGTTAIFNVNVVEQQ